MVVRLVRQGDHKTMHGANAAIDKRQVSRRDLIPSGDAVVELFGCHDTAQSFFNVSLLDQNETGASMALPSHAMIQQGDQGRLYNPGQTESTGAIPFEVRWVQATPAVCCIGVQFDQTAISSTQQPKQTATTQAT